MTVCVQYMWMENIPVSTISSNKQYNSLWGVHQSIYNYMHTGRSRLRPRREMNNRVYKQMYA